MTVDVDDVYPEEGIEALRMRGHNVTGEFFRNALLSFSSELTDSLVYPFSCIVAEFMRVAAVVQAVVKQGDTIYGMYSVFRVIQMHMLTHPRYHSRQ